VDDLCKGKSFIPVVFYIESFKMKVENRSAAKKMNEHKHAPLVYLTWTIERHGELGAWAVCSTCGKAYWEADI